MPRASVVVVGSINLDTTLDVERLPAEGETLLASGLRSSLGGKGANQAIAAARLGAPTAFIGAVGDDAAGAGLLELIEAEGIDLSGVRRVTGPSGQALITVDARGANTIVVAPGANGALRPPDVAGLAARVVLTQLEIPLETVGAALEAGRAAGATTILNPAPARALPNELWSLVDIVVPNEHEASVLTGRTDPAEAAAALRALAPATTVIVTCGSAGAIVAAPDGTGTIPAFAVDAVDSVAAGDAFCGALAAELAGGRLLGDALRWAMAAGAHAVTIAGAAPSLPHRADVERILAS